MSSDDVELSLKRQMNKKNMNSIKECENKKNVKNGGKKDVNGKRERLYHTMVMTNGA